MKFLINALLWIISKISSCGGKCAPIVAIAAILTGCSTGTSYTEGTNLNLGVFAPVDGQLYGANVVSFLSGCRVQAVSNQTFAISRISCSSNTYLWGAAQTNEKTDTSVVFDSEKHPTAKE